MSKKILIVEDDKTIQAILTALLTQAGYETTSALDAVHGTMVARKTQPDLIILDVNMPAGGGASVYDRLVSIKDMFKGAVLIYSVLPRDEVSRRFPALGEANILTKPAAPEEILKAVADLIGPSA